LRSAPVPSNSLSSPGTPWASTQVTCIPPQHTDSSHPTHAHASPPSTPAALPFHHASAPPPLSLLPASCVWSQSGGRDRSNDTGATDSSPESRAEGGQTSGGKRGVRSQCGVGVARARLRRGISAAQANNLPHHSAAPYAHRLCRNPCRPYKPMPPL